MIYLEPLQDNWREGDLLILEKQTFLVLSIDHVNQIATLELVKDA
jgi:hypothetical protein